MVKNVSSRFVINGGKPLHGSHFSPGNKNAALPMIAAAMMADGVVELTNLPIIRDVEVMLTLAQELGAKVTLDRVDRKVIIDPTTLKTDTLPQDLCNRIRTSILFAGALISRSERVVISPPGGDVIGLRRLDTHFDGFKRLGMEIPESIPFEFRRKGRLHGAKILLDEASVTATENLVMAAVKAEGHTVLFNTACEPHVVNLCNMLNGMGAQITGVGTNRLEIEGVEKLHGGSFRIMPDYIESASFIAAAAATRGSIKIENTEEEDFLVLQRPFSRLGVHWTRDESGVLTFDSSLCDLRITNDVSGAIAKIDDGIWPAVPSDLLSVLIVLATQAEGIVLFFEKMFESRLYFIDNLIGMGAHIVQCDPHRIVVHGSGKNSLKSTRMLSPDIRAGMALVLAGLCAEGTTVIGNAESIDRGYESLEKSLSNLGADITREIINE